MKQFLSSGTCQYLFVCTFFLFLSTKNIAQSPKQYILSGTVCDQLMQPLPGAVATLLTVADSSKWNSTTTSLDGHFTFEVPTGNYEISISMMGFKNKIVKIEASTNNKPIIGSIILEENVQNLDEVTVVGSQSHIKFLAGKTIANPKNSISTSQSNSLEVLKSIPGIIVNEDGTIFLNGQKGVKVQINDKDTYLSGNELVGLLKSTHASSVDQVEVITSPSAIHDASGKAGIINIKLKKTAADNSTFTAGINSPQRKNSRGDIWVNASYRKNKTGIWGNFFRSDEDKAKSGKVYRQLQYPISSQLEQPSLQQDINLINKDRTNNFKIGIDYDLSSTTGLGLYGGLNLYNRKTPGSSITSFIHKYSPSDSSQNTTTYTQYKQTTPLAGIKFTYKDHTKQELNFWADYLSFKHIENTALNTSTYKAKDLLSRNNLLGDLNNKINILSIQGDYSKSIASIIQIQAGAKVAWINTDNKAIFKRQSNGVEFIDTSFSSKYSYKESSSAAYLQLQLNIDKWAFQAGLRFENVRINSETFNLSTAKTDSTQENRYSNLFPTISVLYNINQNNNLSISYNRRITRPNYRDLSPLGYIVDENTIIKGNSQLQAELTHNIELSYILDKMYRFSLLYNITNNAISQGFRELPNNGILIMPENMASNKRSGIRLDASRIINFKWWQMGSSLTIYQTLNKWMEQDYEKQDKQVTPMFTINNSFYLKGGWSAQLTGYFNGKISLGQMKVPSGWSVSAGIRKKLFDDKLNLNIYFNDIFASIREKASFESGYINGYSNMRYDETFVGISILFNIRQEKQKKNNDRTIEESRRINY